MSVSVAEFLREEPLEGELAAGVEGALLAVAGVTKVAREDREVWIVDGSPSGPDLIRAVAVVVDDLAPRSRAYIDDLTRGAT